MRVQEVLLDESKRRYMLLDDEGSPIISVVKYMKYLDTINRSHNTQKTYCYALKLYFEYLEDIRCDYKDVNMDKLAGFVAWLRNPYQSSKVAAIDKVKAKRTERTINVNITAVVGFYDYLYRSECIESDVLEKLLKQLHSKGKTSYKDFLYHVSKNNSSLKNVLKLKEPKKKVRVLTKKEVETLYRSTSNIRDKLLIKLLFETGLRIGEALSLYVEDFVFDHKKGHRIKLVDRGELSNGAKLKTGERELHISQELMDLYDDYLYEIIDELNGGSNFVFVKLRGKKSGNPLEYQDVSALFKRLNHKTGIDAHAHLLRHTHATIYYLQTKDLKQVQERLGHSQIQTVANMYLHPSDEEIRKNWEIAQPSFAFEADNDKG